MTISTVDVGTSVPVRLTLDPALAGSGVKVARYLTNEWARRFDVVGRASTADNYRLVLMRVFELMAAYGVADWADVTFEFLQFVENALSATSAYNPKPVWDMLAKAPEGTVGAGVRIAALGQPNVRPKRSSPTEAMPARMLKAVLRQAMRDVVAAETRIAASGWDGVSMPPPDGALLHRFETTAFFILACMEWGQSIDVISDLSFDPSHDTAVTDWGGSHPKVIVRWEKNRGGASGESLLLADGDWRAGSILRRLRDASAATRMVGGEAWADRPWVFAQVVERDTVGRTFGGSSDLPERVVWFGDHGVLVRSRLEPGNDRGFRAWCNHSRGGRTVPIDVMYADGARISFRSIRPAAKWAKFVATGGGLLLSELVDDNTIEVLSAHYLNNEVAHRDIAEAWQQVLTLAEEMARGLRPTLVTESGAVIAGAPISAYAARKARTVNHVGISGCRNPDDSPLKREKKGRLCGQAGRSCYFCGNSVISPSDIPWMKAYLLLAHEAHGNMSPGEWQLRWGLTVRFIRWALPQLDSNWESVEVGPIEMFDTGMQAGPA